jgi:biopolymer transport protein ExbD
VADIAEVEQAQEAYIEPLLAVLARPMVGVAEDDASQQAALAGREITVVADKSLPYEVVKKVMATCTSAAYGRISLAVIEKDRPAGIPGVAAT